MQAKVIKEYFHKNESVTKLLSVGILFIESKPNSYESRAFPIIEFTLSLQFSLELFEIELDHKITEI